MSEIFFGDQISASTAWHYKHVSLSLCFSGAWKSSWLGRLWQNKCCYVFCSCLPSCNLQPVDAGVLLDH